MCPCTRGKGRPDAGWRRSGLLKINTAATAAGLAVTASVLDYYGDGDMYLVLRSNGAGGSQSITATAIAAGGMTNDPEDYTGFGPAPRSDTGADSAITFDGVGASVSSTATIMRITVNSPGADFDGLQFEIVNTLLGLDPIYTQPAPSAGPALPRSAG